MKWMHGAAAAIMLSALILGGCDTEKEGIPVSVEILRSNLPAIKEKVTVSGVVAHLSETDKKAFSIVARDEIRFYSAPDFSRYYVQVSFGGKRPELWDEVRITGRIAHQKEPVLKAKACQVVGHQPAF